MNSEEFVEYYNLIDKYLKNEGGYDSYASFSEKIKGSKNKVVKRFKDELISLGELRNAIVHTPKISGRIIADPHPETVVEIKKLYHMITNPKRVIPAFQFEVLGANENEFINDILIKMKENSFSQFPIFNEEGQVIELINTNTIARWLSDKVGENGTIMLEKARVKDLIFSIEFKKNYRFISRETSVFEAYDIFINQIVLKRRNLDALLISHSGKETEKLLGIITIEDIAAEIKNEKVHRSG